jgi:hypothetical protein
MKAVAKGDEEVILPKNSVCRMKTRGADTHHNEKLLALGCLRVYQARWGGMSIDWAAMLENTGISMKQVIDASKIIEKYFSICDKGRSWMVRNSLKKQRTEERLLLLTEPRNSEL